MPLTAITVESVSKRYQLGSIGATSLRNELERFWSRLRGEQEDRFGDFWALRDVSFEVPKGQVMGIIGRNGAGKSTLLKILSRITEPTEGRITLNGRVGSLLEVGTGFHPELSGRDNIFLNGAILGMKKWEVQRKFDQIVEFAEIGKFIDTPVKRYSSGMYVRLAFAVAAHLEPEILIVDEVLAVGDAAFQARCLGKMREVSHQDGRTILFVSHNMSAIMSLCDQAVLLNNGSVLAVGSPTELVESYLDSGRQISSNINLGDRKNHDESVRVLSGRMLKGDVPCSSFSTGDDLQIELEIEVLKKQSVGVEFFLRDQLGLAIGFCPADIRIPTEEPIEPGIYLARSTLRNLPLAEGHYSLDILLAEPRIRGLDFIQKAFFFEVGISFFKDSPRRIQQSGGQGSLILNIDFQRLKLC